MIAGITAVFKWVEKQTAKKDVAGSDTSSGVVELTPHLNDHSQPVAAKPWSRQPLQLPDIISNRDPPDRWSANPLAQNLPPMVTGKYFAAHQASQAVPATHRPAVLDTQPGSAAAIDRLHALATNEVPQRTSRIAPVHALAMNEVPRRPMGNNDRLAQAMRSYSVASPPDPQT